MKPHGAETPRVDAVTLAPSHRDVALQYVPADFARTLERELAAATAELERCREDAERFEWYFSWTAKGENFMAAYMHGMREHWSLDQWRAAIDAARNAK